MNKKRGLHAAFWVLLAVSLLRGFAGPAINGSSGLFLPPVSEDLGVGLGRLSIYLSVSSLVSVVCLPVAGGLFQRFSAKWLAVIGVLLQTLAFIALGFMRSVWGWYLLAVPLAMGSVLLVNLLGPVLINRWFASHQGLAVGAMMTITSLLGALFQPLLTYLIADRGWRAAYVLFGGVALVAMLIITLLLRDRPEAAGLTPYRAAGAVPEKKSAARGGISFQQAVRSPAFYLLGAFVVILTSFAAFSQHINTMARSHGFSATAIGAALSVTMIGSAIGSLLIGFASDRLGVFSVSIGVLASAALSVGLFLLGGGSYPMLVAAVFLHGLAASSIGVLAPLLVTAYFGAKDYEKLFSFVMMGAPLATVILLPAYGFVYDAVGSYVPVLFALLVGLGAGAACLWAGRSVSRRLTK